LLQPAQDQQSRSDIEEEQPASCTESLKTGPTNSLATPAFKQLLFQLSVGANLVAQVLTIRLTFLPQSPVFDGQLV
jgi:hypothetical protein